MGKQSKKKNRKKQKGPKVKVEESQPNGAITARIRHGDPRVRAGALSALACTMFSPESLSKQKLDNKLLKIISEKILDKDGAVAKNAAGCWNNYLLFSESEENISDEMDIGSILIHRIETCCQLIKEETKKEESKSKKIQVHPSKVMLSQFDIMDTCFQTLCALIENSTNGNGVERMTSNIVESETFLHPPKSVIQIMFDFLSLGIKNLTKYENCEQSSQLIGDCMTWCTRSLHSFVDENERLIPFISKSHISILINLITNGKFPAQTRLHASGTIVSIRTDDDITTICINQIIPMLMPYLDYHLDISTVMAERIYNAKKLLEEEEKDERMENKIIQQINEKKESARNIAKRQKEMKKDKDKDKKQSNSKPNTRKNPQEEYENAVQAWKNALSPLKLALEVTTNLCVGVNQMLDEDCIMYDVDDDDEQNEINPVDIPIRDAIVQTNLLQRILSILQTISSPISSPIPMKQEDNMIHSDMTQIKSKCSACLGNILTLLNSNHDIIVTIWNALCNAILITPDTIKDTNDMEGMLGIIHTMSFLLQSKPQFISNVNVHEQIPFFLPKLQLIYENQDQDQDSNMENMIQNIISIVSKFMLVNTIKQHNDVIIIFKNMVMQPKTSLSITNEILNALMDVYGNDDIELDGLFDSLEILQLFQSILSKFKNNIQKVQKAKECTKDEISQWNETALNGARFIDYKNDSMKL